MAEWQAAHKHLLAQIEERRAQEAAQETARLAAEAQRIAEEEASRAELAALHREAEARRDRIEAAQHSQREEQRSGSRRGSKPPRATAPWPNSTLALVA